MSFSQVLHDNGWGYYVVRKYDGLTYHMRIDYREYWWNSKIIINTVRLYSADNNLGDVEIPATVWYTANSPYVKDTEHFVSSVWDKAFKGKVGITSVSFPTGITSIGNECFMNCVDLESVKFGGIFKQFYLGPACFESCTKLKQVVLPDSVIDNGFSLNNKTFKNCSNLQKIVLPKNCFGANDNAFEGCVNLYTVNLGVSVNWLGEEAFSGCSNLKVIISQNPIPPLIRETTFDGSIYENATLKVPIGSKDAYMNSPYWCKFFNIEETNELEDVSDKKESVNALYDEAANIYNSFINYYNGEAHNEYVAALTQHNSNIKNAKYGLSVIDSLKTAISESVLSEESKQSYKETLDGIGNEINALLVRNNQHELSFNDVVCEHLDIFNAYNERLTQCKEQIEAATTNDELEAVIATINADIKDMQDNHLKPIENSYADMLEIIPILAEVGDELKSCIERIGTLKTEIDTAIDEANNSLAEKIAEAEEAYKKAMDVYTHYQFYYKDGGMQFYNQVLGEQADNDDMAYGILKEIDILKQTVLDSSLSEEEKKSFNNMLYDMEKAVLELKWENEVGYYIAFYDRVMKHYDYIIAYYERLFQYKERIDAATTNDELDAVIAEMNQDAEEMYKNYIEPITIDYNTLWQIESRIHQIGVELETYKKKLQNVSAEINEHITSGIETIASTDGSIIAYTLKGERLIIKASQVKSLPKGIYIINGKKYNVK